MTLPLTVATGLPRVVPRLRWLRTAFDNAALASGNAPLVAGATTRWTATRGSLSARAEKGPPRFGAGVTSQPGPRVAGAWPNEPTT